MSRAGCRITASAKPERVTLVLTWLDAALVARINRKKEIMIKQVSDCSSQTPESPAVPVVVLVEHRDDVFDRLKHCFTRAGFCVTRARNSVEAVERYVSEPTNLLVLNANQPAETAWLLVAKLHLTHPAARIWVYIFQPSTFDVAAANLLAIEELIEYDGKVEKLESQLEDRLRASADMPVPCPGSSTRIDPVEAAA